MADCGRHAVTAHLLIRAGTKIWRVRPITVKSHKSRAHLQTMSSKGFQEALGALPAFAPCSLACKLRRLPGGAVIAKDLGGGFHRRGIPILVVTKPDMPGGIARETRYTLPWTAHRCSRVFAELAGD